MRLDEWRAQRRETIVLPSGLTVTVRRVAAVDVAARGQLPSTLTAVVRESVMHGSDFEPSIEDMSSVHAVYCAVAHAALVGPEGLDVESELPFADLGAIFAWANGGATALEKFCEEQAGALGD